MTAPEYPKIQQVSNRIYHSTEDYEAYLDGYGLLRIKKGFAYDGASIPRVAWPLIGSPFTGTHTRGAYIHDALYASELLPRVDCDWIFLDIMEACGAGWIKRNLMWSAVRPAGYFVWKKHSPESIAKARELIEIC